MDIYSTSQIGLFDIFRRQNAMESMDAKKFMSRLVKSSKQKAKLKVCPLCGKEQTSFCNSHSIPQFVLNNIAVNGKLLQFAALAAYKPMIEENLVDIEKGIKNSCTFQFICRECDSKLFSDYEDEISLCKLPTRRMMAEIDVKNSLLMLYKRLYELPMYESLAEILTTVDQGNAIEFKSYDVRDHYNDLSESMRIVAGEHSAGYKLLYWNVLPYKVPLACQTHLALEKTILGNRINDIYSNDPNYAIQNAHLCVFPLKDKTAIILFYPKRNKRYMALEREFNCLTEKAKLQYISYLIFSQTENFVLSPAISKELLQNTYLKLAAQESQGVPNMGFVPKGLAGIVKQYYIPISWKQVPNIFDLKYEIN